MIIPPWRTLNHLPNGFFRLARDVSLPVCSGIPGSDVGSWILSVMVRQKLVLLLRLFFKFLVFYWLPVSPAEYLESHPRS